MHDAYTRKPARLEMQRTIPALDSDENSILNLCTRFLSGSRKCCLLSSLNAVPQNSLRARCRYMLTSYHQSKPCWVTSVCSLRWAARS